MNTTTVVKIDITTLFCYNTYTKKLNTTGVKKMSNLQLIFRICKSTDDKEMAKFAIQTLKNTYSGKALNLKLKQLLEVGV